MRKLLFVLIVVLAIGVMAYPTVDLSHDMFADMTPHMHMNLFADEAASGGRPPYLPSEEEDARRMEYRFGHSPNFITDPNQAQKEKEWINNQGWNADMCQGKNVLDCAKGMQGIGNFVNVLNNRAPEFERIRNDLNSKNITLLIPSDPAMEKAVQYLEHRFGMPLTPEGFNDIVSLHTLKCPINLTTLGDRQYSAVETMLKDPNWVHLNGEGQRIILFNNNGTYNAFFGVLHAPLYTVRILSPLIKASNGNVLVVNSVMWPAPSLSTALRQTGHSELANMPAVSVLAAAKPKSTFLMPSPAAMSHALNEMLQKLEAMMAHETGSGSGSGSGGNSTQPATLIRLMTSLAFNMEPTSNETEPLITTAPSRAPGTGTPLSSTAEDFRRRCQSATTDARDPSLAVASYASMLGIRLPRVNIDCDELARRFDERREELDELRRNLRDNVAGNATMDEEDRRERQQREQEIRNWCERQLSGSAPTEGNSVRAVAARFGLTWDANRVNCEEVARHIANAESAAHELADDAEDVAEEVAEEGRRRGRTARAMAEPTSPSSPSPSNSNPNQPRRGNERRRRRDPRTLEEAIEMFVPELSSMKETCDTTLRSEGRNGVVGLVEEFNVTVPQNQDEIKCDRLVEKVRQRMIELVTEDYNEFDRHRRESANEQPNANRTSGNAPSSSSSTPSPATERPVRTQADRSREERVHVPGIEDAPEPTSDAEIKEKIVKQCEKIVARVPEAREHLERMFGRARRQFHGTANNTGNTNRSSDDVSLDVPGLALDCNKLADRALELLTEVKQSEYGNVTGDEAIMRARQHQRELVDKCNEYVTESYEGLRELKPYLRAVGIDLTRDHQVNCDIFIERLIQAAQSLPHDVRARSVETLAEGEAGSGSGGGEQNERQRMKREMIKEIIRIMTNHVIPNRLVYPADLTNDATLKTASGKELKVKTEQAPSVNFDPNSESNLRTMVDRIKIGDARVTGLSIVRNGVIIFIDRLLK